jgi:lysophospholipase L1-like esterase
MSNRRPPSARAAAPRWGVALALAIQAATSACAPRSPAAPSAAYSGAAPAATPAVGAAPTALSATHAADAPIGGIAPADPSATEPTAAPAPAPASTSDATSAPAVSAAPPDLPPDTTLLHIGDSFAGALGIDLNRELKAVGVRGVLKYETATYIPTWASGKDLDTYLWRFHPDLVLITLGANELQIPDPAERIPTIHRLVARLGGRPCVWVGPPLWDGAKPALLETIRSSCAPCVYLDSSALVPGLARARDHIHPSMEARKIWAKAVLGWLRAHRVVGGARPWDLTP